jgi:Asp-tRNA(Asn)/Glu-tRNA(Gln) amidotransferase B subunit
VLVEIIDQADSSPEEVVDKNDWRQVNDKEYLQTVSRKVLDDNLKLVNISI